MDILLGIYFLDPSENADMKASKIGNFSVFSVFGTDSKRIRMIQNHSVWIPNHLEINILLGIIL